MLKKSRGWRLAAAHVDHGLRSAARSDERWVRRFCHNENLEYHALRVDVKARAKTESESVEEAARRGRYSALLDLAVQKKFGYLATAHTADDQAETVLMRLGTGSGLWGLAAIPEARTERGVRIVRPLLGVAKPDLEAALRRAKVSFRTDRSNLDSKFLRNRLRRTILPLLKRELNPRLTEHLSDLAADAGEWRAWSERYAGEFIRACGARRSGEVRFAERRLRSLPAPLRAPVYFSIAESLTGREQHLRREHIRQIETLVDGSVCGKRQLPFGLSVERRVQAGKPQIIWSVRSR